MSGWSWTTLKLSLCVISPLNHDLSSWVPDVLEKIVRIIHQWFSVRSLIFFATSLLSNHLLFPEYVYRYTKRRRSRNLLTTLKKKGLQKVMDWVDDRQGNSWYITKIICSYYHRNSGLHTLLLTPTDSKLSGRTSPWGFLRDNNMILQTAYSFWQFYSKCSNAHLRATDMTLIESSSPGSTQTADPYFSPTANLTNIPAT